MNSTLFLIIAYLMLWLVLFGYVVVMNSRLEKLSQQLKTLQAEQEKGE